MNLRHISPRVLIAGSTIAVHALALYGVAVGMRDRSAVTVAAPVSVRFIEEQPQQQAQLPPPAVRIVAPVVTPKMPEVLIEIPVIAEPSQRAISIPVRAAAAPSPAGNQIAPKLISTVEYVREPAPRYPPQSRRLREQGLVVLRVLIDERGAACSIEVETSSGYARLDAAARDAVSRAAFRPYVEDGAPRRAFVLIPVEFALNPTRA